MDDKNIMIEQHLKARGINNHRVLSTMKKVPREEFVAKGYESVAYTDAALPIGKSQTISQPYIVALMAQALNLKGDEKVLEIGTGSGYGAAVLSNLCREVITIERIPELAERAKEKLADYDNVKVLVADGTMGSPEGGIFDRIIVTAYAHEVPEALFYHLKDRGYLIAPVGDGKRQVLTLFKKLSDRIVSEELIDVAFVPLVSDE